MSPKRFQKEEIPVFPGDCICSDEDIVLSAILGSCIAVVLYDGAKKLGGLNHTMLSPEEAPDKSTLYGRYSLDTLLEEMLLKGAKQENLIAKVFGGASLYNPSAPSSLQVGRGNISFAFQYLMEKRIPIRSSDTGDTISRKVYLFPQTGKVLLKRLADRPLLAALEEKQ